MSEQDHRANQLQMTAAIVGLALIVAAFIVRRPIIGWLAVAAFVTLMVTAMIWFR